MKNIVITSVLVVFSAFVSKAQTTGTANLNITLSNVLSMTVTQPASLSVDFNTEQKYSDGITALAVDHISVISNKGFLIKAVSGIISGSSSLSSSSIKLTALIGTTNQGNTVGLSFSSNIVLPPAGGTSLDIISSSNSTWNGSNSTNKFNIEYSIGALGAYANKTTGANVIPVIYSITQP